MIDFKRMDHILITIPPGAKADARNFYTRVLGLKEISGNHPRGAMWFQAGDVQLHVREETGQQTSSDRHPAFEVGSLEKAEQFLRGKRIPITYSSEIEGRERCFFRDPGVTVTNWSHLKKTNYENNLLRCPDRSINLFTDENDGTNQL